VNRNKIAVAIALFLMLAVAFSLVALPVANAHDPSWTIPTYAYISAEPNPVGVGQTAYVNFWIDKVPPTAEGLWGSRWHDMKVTVTKPNGATDDLGTFNSDATGGAWTQYIPDEAGEYKFTFNFPTQVAYDDNPYPYFSGLVFLGMPFLNDTYTESSATTTLTVQEAQITSDYPPNPLPTEYWQRPINSMNRNWFTLGGNWLGLGAEIFGNTGLYDSSNGGFGGNFNPYTTAPNSAHVLWTQPVAFGGQIGGEFGDSETSLFATGTAYESKFGAVIIYGILYYTQYPGAMNNQGPLTAVDLRTGKTLWTVNASNPLRCGMVYNFITGDQYGAHAYLFTSPAGYAHVLAYTPNVWSMYDAMTGQWVLDIADPHPGLIVEGPNGELLSYTSNGTALTMWNASKCIAVGSNKINVWSGYHAEEIWRPPLGATINWTDGYEWTVPIATDISGKPIAPSLVVTKVSDGVALMTTAGLLGGVPGGSQLGYRIDAGYSADDGHLLWGPVNRTLTPFTNVPMGPAAEGVYTDFTCQTMTWAGYDIKTGSKLWGPTKPYNSSWGYFDNNAKGVIGYGNLYVWSLNGEVYCYDVKTGDQKWSWSGGPAGVDTPYGIWPLGTWAMQHILADGKLYVRSGHDYTPPVFKGAKLYCLNATTGDLIWDSLSFNVISSPAVADGHMVWLNGYDNQIYAYGKGQTATTITASPKVSVHGDSVLVEGTVTDQSPGQTCLGIPAAGTPAIADEDMSAWMEYLYQQQPKPANATGVKVTITVLDPNNNCYDVSTATSDIDGFYRATFTPQVPGAYTVYATFTGSESYFGSSALTAINVEEAPAATAPPTAPPASLADIYFLPMSIVILIVVIVGIIVLVLMLRKR
jgi:outer membrane protein assembly factor BamB